MDIVVFIISCGCLILHIVGVWRLSHGGDVSDMVESLLMVFRYFGQFLRFILIFSTYRKRAESSVNLIDIQDSNTSFLDDDLALYVPLPEAEDRSVSSTTSDPSLKKERAVPPRDVENPSPLYFALSDDEEENEPVAHDASLSKDFSSTKDLEFDEKGPRTL